MAKVMITIEDADFETREVKTRIIFDPSMIPMEPGKMTPAQRLGTSILGYLEQLKEEVDGLIH